MKINLLFACIVLFAFLFAVPDKQLVRDQVYIHYAEKDVKIAAIAADVVSRQRNRLRDQYGLTPLPIHIYIADDQKVYRQYSGSNSPVWSMGLASEDRMLVKSPSFSRQTLQDFQRTLLHETVHLAVSGIPLPVWFNEGFAQVEAGQFDLQKKVLVSRAFWRQDLMRTHEIGRLMQMDARKAGIAYAQSAAMVEHLIKYYGVELVGKCLFYAQEIGDFNKAFVNAFLTTPDHFEKQWREQTRNRYLFYILLDQNNVIWIIAPFLLVTGFFLNRYRRKKLLKKWADEELQQEEMLD